MTGLTTWRLPELLTNAAQWVLGAGIAGGFVNLAPREVLSAAATSLGYFVLLMALALAAALVAHAVTGVHLVATLLAFIPGGQAEMTILAIVAGADVAFVALHHVIRVFLVILGAPLLKRFI